MKMIPHILFDIVYYDFGLMCLFGAKPHAEIAPIFRLTVLISGWDKKEGEQELEILIQES